MGVNVAIKYALNAQGAAPVYGCRAWVNFNGTGTVGVRASGNVSSITDLGTGVWRVNLTKEMPDTNFATIISFGQDSGSTGNGLYASKIDSAGLSTTAQQIRCGRPDTGVLADADFVSVAFFR